MKKKKRIPLYLTIILGMVAGLLLGILAVNLNFGEIVTNWVKPWGVIFIRMLKLIAVPLVFVSIVVGISSLGSIQKLGTLGVKTVGLYFLSMVGSAAVGLLLVNTIRPGHTFPEEKRAYYMEQFQESMEEKSSLADGLKQDSPLQFIVDMVPENIISSGADNSNMLQIIFFAILLAAAIVMIKGEKTAPFTNLIESLHEILLKVIGIIMQFAPIGVLALLAGLVVDFAADTDLFTALGLYFITVVLGLTAAVMIFYPVLLKVFVKKVKFFRFLKAIAPAQMVAFSTSSSAATLPVTLKQNIDELGVSEDISNFVLPVGTTINMDGTACYQAIAAVFIAQVFGVDLSIFEQIAIVMTAILAAIGSPGIPGGSIVMLVIVLSSAGIPVEGLALIIGIDRPLDMLRTVVNITGDSAVNYIVGKTENKLDTSKTF
ncbi:MAG: dicarboxylate/amino acid:cation symporter [Bacteroidales bacterium]|nr:dicarboxylate/amino acid:cation symporter [Bacteroidales bacterium]MDD2569859.1 dicarboxylate/amino acid:cation symporter [Bacteroidales bacterium]MDD2811795.1 dicarboxylate/amino acid:cation symporter [Bacteroidales bacterium]MDD3384706.1 dicarboxylate/amino acid:cation symporter [Bacteroidales bacterium]MDD3810955.1 dicarboxylate/amino acid:cation symporter [Bacteroidales bacterium]